MFKKALLLIALLTFQQLATAQPTDMANLLRFRASLHNPVKPTGDFFYADKTGAIVPLNLRIRDLTPPELTTLVNGSLVLYDKLAVDPKNPAASIAATCVVPPGVKRGIFVIVPSPAGIKPPFRMICIEDSFKTFLKGESRVLTLIPKQAAIEAGEHKIAIHPGVLTRVPAVTKVDEYNMAQMKVHYMPVDQWVPVTERQLQFLEGFRRIFILHTTPGAMQPTVSTLIDKSDPAAPSAAAATP
jgi:hypothetical protein